jgi:hypothetical protein
VIEGGRGGGGGLRRCGEATGPWVAEGRCEMGGHGRWSTVI